MERRTFLAALGTALAATRIPLQGTEPVAGSARITLLHTNDTHSHIEPLPQGSGAHSGKGGMARRATLVKELRKELGNVLLLDSGDVFQGTPWFNLYKGKMDYRLMSVVGYDAVTLGNHDFDNGVEGLLAAMEEATFPFVSANLDCSGAPALAKRVQPYLVKSLPGIKVGLTGLCVSFKGLVAPKNHEGVIWRDPVASVTPVVQHLREREKVDLVVVLSHLGHDMKGQAMDDLTLAKAVPGIDAILGGHTHTFLDQPVRIANGARETLIQQVGFGGVHLGRLDFTVAKGKVLACAGGPIEVRA